MAKQKGNNDLSPRVSPSFWYLSGSNINNMYLLTKWEGRTEKIFDFDSRSDQDVRTERREVLTSRPRAKCFSLRSDLAPSISLYHTTT